jgi:hypothetical protein
VRRAFTCFRLKSGNLLAVTVELWRSARVGWQWKPGIWLGDVIKAIVISIDISVLDRSGGYAKGINCRRG